MVNVGDTLAVARTVSQRRGAVRRAILLCLVAGLVVGLGWGLAAPGLPVTVQAGGRGLIVDPEAPARFDPVAYFALASLAAGLVTGALAWWWWPGRRTPLLIVSVVLAALAGGALAESVGVLVAGLHAADAATAAVGSRVDVAPRLGTWLLVVVQPLGTAVALVAACVVAPDPEQAVQYQQDGSVQADRQ